VTTVTPIGCWAAPPGTRPKGRCPVQPSTPLGPSQVKAVECVDRW
jgi:hypothetical protein